MPCAESTRVNIAVAANTLGARRISFPHCVVLGLIDSISNIALFPQTLFSVRAFLRNHPLHKAYN